ncbi:MAG: hypothetical protein CVV25_11660 [Ignavibacteriae bacterium HGW-Ignavibacteriae-4]|jgi:hypothetical protein|nr:MAG: hypothetical protein CVV25_11660 [Ignavibacteriae bacterium HGW-Ignavibacteriae-4]
MNKLNFYRTAAIALLSINLAVIGFFLFANGNRGEHPQMEGPDFKHKVIEILDLDNSQKELFYESAKRHNQMMNSLDKKQSQILQVYFRGLVEGINEEEKERFVAEYNDLESQKINGTFSHFEEVKSYLRPEQIGNYKKFVNKAVKRLLSKSSKPPPPPKHK